MIIWKSQYDTKIKKIDNQHKELVNILNLISDEKLINMTDEIFADVVDRILKYTNYHFSTEEEIMRKYDYQSIDHHIKEHKEFIKSIDDLIRKSKSIKIVLLSGLGNYIKTWIINHVLGVDMELAEYLISIGAEELYEGD